MGEITLELSDALPKGLGVHAERETPPESGLRMTLPPDETSVTLQFNTAREVQALNAPHPLPLIAAGEKGSIEAEAAIEVPAVVTSYEDSPDGSLRDLIESAPALRTNPTIRFASWVFLEGTSPFIALASEVAITDDPKIEGPLPEGEAIVSLDAGGLHRVSQDRWRKGRDRGIILYSGEGPRPVPSRWIEAASSAPYPGLGRGCEPPIG